MRSRRKDAWRLSPMAFNGLIDTIAQENNAHPNGPIVKRMNIEELHLRFKPLYRIIEKNNKKYAIFEVTKDAETASNEPNLAYVGKVIEKAKEDADLLNARLLIPMRQCRGFAKLPLWTNLPQRAHIVLADIDLATNRVQIHDAQSPLRNAFYPDKLKEIAKDLHLNYDPDRDFHAYNIQNDEMLCGYFVHQFTSAILNGQRCEHVSLELVWDKDAYIVNEYKVGQENPTQYESIGDYLESHGFKDQEAQEALRDSLQSPLPEIKEPINKRII